MGTAEDFLNECPSGATTKGLFKGKEVIKVMKDYARLMIEKDRESQIELHIRQGLGENSPIFELIRNLPITLK